jgi:hypothetical protein
LPSGAFLVPVATRRRYSFAEGCRKFARVQGTYGVIVHVEVEVIKVAESRSLQVPLRLLEQPATQILHEFDVAQIVGDVRLLASDKHYVSKDARCWGVGWCSIIDDVNVRTFGQPRWIAFGVGLAVVIEIMSIIDTREIDELPDDHITKASVQRAPTQTIELGEQFGTLI